eukprot:1508622-Rhodomonas_salina.2
MRSQWAAHRTASEGERIALARSVCDALARGTLLHRFVRAIVPPSVLPVCQLVRPSLRHPAFCSDRVLCVLSSAAEQDGTDARFTPQQLQPRAGIVLSVVLRTCAKCYPSPTRCCITGTTRLQPGGSKAGRASGGAGLNSARAILCAGLSSRMLHLSLHFTDLR